MKNVVAQLAVASVLLTAGHVYGEDDAHTFTIKTKGGLAIESADKAYSFKLGGRIQLDYNNYDGVLNADQDGDAGSDLFFRRARLVASGTVASDWQFKAEFNLGENGGGDYTDLYIKYKGFGNSAMLTFGHQREPFGLENLTSSKNITKFERSVASGAFDVGRATGANLSGYADSWMYSAGIYDRGQDESEDINFAYTARGTFLPFESDTTLIHLGAGIRFSEEDIDNDDINSRPGIRSVDSSDRISTGDIIGEENTLFNIEAAAVIGSVHFSSEYYSMSIDGGDTADTDVDGYYFQAGWFLTGEKRPYSKKSGSFDKLKPKKSSGAYEIFADYSALNLSDNGIGNDGTVTTIGLNWYANSAVRTGINLVYTDYDTAIVNTVSGNSEESGFGISTRLQLVF